MREIAFTETVISITMQSEGTEDRCQKGDCNAEGIYDSVV